MTQLYSVVSVEDDLDVFDLIKDVLRPLPIQLHHAKTGTEALSLIPQVNADLLILDISLPDIHGWDVLKTLSERNQSPNGIIVLTARTDPAHRVMAHFQQVTAYISKPFKPAELIDIIRETLGLV
jgi:DNA-binding response OmpR family regulator